MFYHNLILNPELFDFQCQWHHIWGPRACYGSRLGLIQQLVIRADSLQKISFWANSTHNGLLCWKSSIWHQKISKWPQHSRDWQCLKWILFNVNSVLTHRSLSWGGGIGRLAERGLPFGPIWLKSQYKWQTPYHSMSIMVDNCVCHYFFTITGSIYASRPSNLSKISSSHT